MPIADATQTLPRDAPLRIRPEHLANISGLRRTVKEALLAIQPVTVLDALAIRGVGRSTTRRLLNLNLITNPTRLQRRGMTAEEFEVYFAAMNPDLVR